MSIKNLLAFAIDLTEKLVCGVCLSLLNYNNQNTNSMVFQLSKTEKVKGKTSNGLE